MHSTINNLPVGRNVDETLRVLPIQYVRRIPMRFARQLDSGENHEPDPVGSKEFFAAVN